MRNKRMGIYTLIVVIALSCVSYGIVMASPANDENTTVQTAHDLNSLKNSGVTLKKITVVPSITEEIAIKKASDYAAGYAAEAKSINAEYHALTNKNFTLFSEKAKEKNGKLKKDGYLNDTPVYIVTFKGITKKAHGSRLHPNPPDFHEYNLVIDANSGEVLYGFSYR